MEPGFMKVNDLREKTIERIQAVIKEAQGYVKFAIFNEAIVAPLFCTIYFSLKHSHTRRGGINAMLRRAGSRGGLLHRRTRNFDVGYSCGVANYLGSGRCRRGSINRSFILYDFTLVLKFLNKRVENASPKFLYFYHYRFLF